jgi:hypothetical protein
MTQSIFSKIYTYRERENKHSKENFLIEIFAHCLYHDKKFQSNFLKYLNIQSDEEVIIKTQAVYGLGRPDIEINIPSQNLCILIECKIEHFERPNQLEDYKKILESKIITKRHLVYLTKYYDFRVNHKKKIKLHLLKWADIFLIIDEYSLNITKEFKSFIKDEDMSESKNFTYTDLTVLKSITGTIRKMDEVLDGVKEYYESKIGILSKESARSTRMKDEWYSTSQIFNHPPNYRFDIDFGFIWWDDEIWLGTRVYIPTSEKYKNTENYLKLFKRVLKSWEIEEFDNCITIGEYKPLAQFIIEEEEQIPAMLDYLKKCVDKLETLKRSDPKIFK